MPTETAAPASPTEQQFFAEGMTVEVGKIPRELKKLWQDSTDSATRASRLNLVIYSAADHSLRANTALVERIARQHALRAILIAAKANAGRDGVRAWVNAHCQLSKNGRKQRCSEQIGLLLEGKSARRELVPNMIFAHLDSDLPLFLWRQGEFSDSPSEQLMAWVDCLIFDSAEWAQPAAQFGIVKRLAAAAKLEDGLADLNWTRLGGLRAAVAQFFDAPGAQEELAELEAVEIVHAPGARTQAALLVGWLGAQLGWKGVEGDASGFRAADGRPVAVRLQEQEGGPAIGRVELRTAGGGWFVVAREAGSRFFNTKAHCCTDFRDHAQMLPVGPEEKADLVSAELVHGGGHRAYARALELVGPWLG